MERKIILYESQLQGIIFENEIEEMAYPSSFNWNEFANITNIKDRIRYCSQRLKILGTGSSRRAYKVDNEKVLKIAINRKGLAQNEQECDGGYSNIAILPHVYNFDDEHYTWIETEIARKAVPSDFQKYVGYPMETVFNGIRQYEQEYNPHWLNGKLIKYQYVPKDLYQEMWDNEWMWEMFEYLGNYQHPLGDILRLEHYGVIKRNGKPCLILIDAGLNEDIWDSFYSRPRLRI